MRLCLEFNVKIPEMIIEYRRVIVSYIKETLSIAHGGKYFNDYYCNTKKKPFTFSVLFNNPKFTKDNVRFDNNSFKVYFSVCDEKMAGLIMCNSFLKMKNRKFPLSNDNYMWLTNIRKINECIITENRAIFRTTGGSPVIVREHNRKTNKDKYYTCEDFDYNNKLQEKIRYQFLTEGYSDDEIDKIIVNDTRGKKVVVKSYGIYIDGVNGLFDISAPSEILQKIYTEGLSSKRSMGFGFVDVVR